MITGLLLLGLAGAIVGAMNPLYGPGWWRGWMCLLAILIAHFAGAFFK